MSNRLKMEKVHAIIGLLEHGWSHRRIARELGIDRGTVSRYDRLRREVSKPAIPTPGSDTPGTSNPAKVTPGSGSSWDPKPAISTPGTAPGRVSLCELFRGVITGYLEAGLHGQRIWQDLSYEHGFTGSYSSVKRFIRKLGACRPLPFRRMSTEPGQEVQVDFGTGAWVVKDGRRRRPHVLRVTLSCSRKSYSEPVFGQTTENFIRCIKNAFRYFGGAYTSPDRSLVFYRLRNL